MTRNIREIFLALIFVIIMARKNKRNTRNFSQPNTCNNNEHKHTRNFSRNNSRNNDNGEKNT